jgi:hypothetical protein
MPSSVITPATTDDLEFWPDGQIDLWVVLVDAEIDDDAGGQSAVVFPSEGDAYAYAEWRESMGWPTRAIHETTLGVFVDD